jgi:hypothetical protein
VVLVASVPNPVMVVVLPEGGGWGVTSDDIWSKWKRMKREEKRREEKRRRREGEREGEEIMEEKRNTDQNLESWNNTKIWGRLKDIQGHSPVKGMQEKDPHYSFFSRDLITKTLTLGPA